VNVELAKHGHKAQLANGGGYFSFWGGGAQDCDTGREKRSRHPLWN
jgi:hypothetical protein